MFSFLRLESGEEDGRSGESDSLVEYLQCGPEHEESLPKNWQSVEDDLRLEQRVEEAPLLSPLPLERGGVIFGRSDRRRDRADGNRFPISLPVVEKPFF